MSATDDAKRTVSTAPPPRREADVPIDLESDDATAPSSPEDATGHKLNLGGFVEEPTTAPEDQPSTAENRKGAGTAKRKARRTQKRHPAPSGRQISSTGMTKTTIQLPNRLVGQLRDWTTRTGRSNADAVLTAYMNQLDAVRKQHEPTADDKRRAELGLPPLSSTSPPPADSEGERRVQVGLYVRAAAVDEVDTTANELGLSRSQFVTELLDLELD